MKSPRSLTPEEREMADERVGRFFGFVQDVLEDPAVLEHLPQHAAIELTPLEEKRPGQHYLAETLRFAVSDAREGDQ